MEEFITDTAFSLIAAGAVASEPQKLFLENLHMSIACFFGVLSTLVFMHKRTIEYNFSYQIKRGYNERLAYL